MIINLGVDAFPSLASFLSFIESRQTNRAFVEAGRYSSHTRGYDFTMTNSFEEAQQLLRAGYPEGLKAMLEAKTSIPFNVHDRQFTRKVDFVGQRPHIVNAIIGKPKTMVRRIKEQPKVHTVSLLYDAGAGASVDADELAKGGKNLMALIQHLENHNIRVELNLMMSASVRKGKCECDAGMAKIKIKDCKQQLNPLMLSYPLTHPSFWRRQGFRWIETSRLTNDSRYPSVYGSNIRYAFCTVQEFADQLHECKVLGANDYYLDVETCAHARSLDDLFKAMRLKIN